MASNAFTGAAATNKPPAYCTFRKIPLPIFPIPFGPPRLQGWARWTDLAPIPGPVDVAMYITLPRIASSYTWRGEATKAGFRLMLILQRLQDPNPYAVTLVLWTPWYGPELHLWNPVVVQFEPAWDTGPLEFTHLPGLDFRQARVQQ